MGREEKKKLGFIMAVAVAFVIFSCAYGGDGGYGDMPADEQTQEEPKDGMAQDNMQGDMQDGMQDDMQGNMQENVVEIRVELFQFGFEPAEIRVKKGSKVRIIARSRDVTHGLAINEFGVNQTVGTQDTVIEFTADKTGSFTIYCSVFCGAGHSNMKGTLIVE